MNPQENDKLDSNSRVTRATAYLAVGIILLVGVSLFLLITILQDGKQRLSEAERANTRQDLTLSDYGHRLTTVEVDQLQAQEERDEIEADLLKVISEMKSDLQLVRDYVIEQKAKVKGG